MSPIRIDEQLLEFYKLSLGSFFPSVKSSHRMEALAAGFGHGPYASLTAARKASSGELAVPGFSRDLFAERLSQLGYMDVEVPADVIESLFSYRTFVAQKNGFSIKTVHALASASGCADNQATIFAEMLCSQPLIEEQHTILSEERVRFILGVVPRFRAPPLEELNMMERALLPRDPYRNNPGATVAMLRIWNWKVRLGEPEKWFLNTPIVHEVHAAKQGCEVSFRLSRDGLRVLRMTEESLSLASANADGFSGARALNDHYETTGVGAVDDEARGGEAAPAG